MFNQDENLRIVRQKLGMTQQSFADSIGVKQTKIKDIESKNQKIPLELAYQVEKIHHINFKWLLTGEGEMYVKNNNDLTKQPNVHILDNLTNFHKRFNKIQSDNQLNDFQMSKLTEISESRIEKLGIGKAMPTLDELNALKKHFNVSIDWLLYGEGEKQENSAQKEDTLSAEEIAILKKIAQKFNF